MSSQTMNQNNPFSDYKFHPSSLGDLMTNLNSITEKQIEKLNELKVRQEEGRLTDRMAVDLQALQKKLDDQETVLSTLPKGAISKLDEIYWEVVWDRKTVIDSRYMEKGNMVEQDSLNMLSRADKKFYKKNTDYHSNDYLVGCPDTFTDVKVIDVKSSWDHNTFEKAVLTSLYEWQIKGYMWILKKKYGELVYCLVNAPGYMLTKEIERKWYQYGQPDENNDWWIKMVSQIERNMIYDFERFRDDNPNKDMQNTGVAFTVPAKFRIKRYDVSLSGLDIKSMRVRLQACREYLVNRYNMEEIQDLRAVGASVNVN